VIATRQERPVARSGRTLWPREHGAYFQLALPLLTVGARRAPSLAVMLLALAAVAAFLAHEPWLVVLGHRGPRRRVEDGPRARTRLLLLASAAIGLGVAGLAISPRGTVAAAAIIAVPVAVAIGCGYRRVAHTLAGELVAVVALTGASFVVQVAGGVARGAALDAWLGWSLGFAASTIAVHRVIARHKHAASWVDRVCALVLAGGFAACLWRATPGGAFAIAAPLVGLAAVVVAAPPSARRLRAIGLATVAAGTLAGVLATLATVP